MSKFEGLDQVNVTLRSAFFEKKIREVKAGSLIMERIRQKRLERQIERQDEKMKSNYSVIDSMKKKIRGVERSLLRLKREAAILRGGDLWEEEKSDSEVIGEEEKIEEPPKPLEITFLNEEMPDVPMNFSRMVRMDCGIPNARVICPRSVEDLSTEDYNDFHVFCPGAISCVLVFDDHFWYYLSEESRKFHFEGKVFLGEEINNIDIFVKFKEEGEMTCLMNIGRGDSGDFVNGFDGCHFAERSSTDEKFQILKPMTASALKKGSNNQFIIKIAAADVEKEKEKEDSSCCLAEEVCIILDDVHWEYLRKRKTVEYGEVWEGTFFIPFHVSEVDVFVKWKDSTKEEEEETEGEKEDKESSSSRDCYASFFSKTIDELIEEEEEEKERQREAREKKNCFDLKLFSFFDSKYGCEFINPLNPSSDLKVAERNRFEFLIPKAVEVAVVFDEMDWNFLSLMDKNRSIFVGDVFIPAEFSNIGVYASYDGRFNELLFLIQNKNKNVNDDPQSQQQSNDVPPSPLLKKIKSGEVLKYEMFNRKKCELISPTNLNEVEWSEMNEFRIRCPKAKEVALVIDDQEWNFLTRVSKDYLFEGEFKIDGFVETLDIYAVWKDQVNECIVSYSFEEEDVGDSMFDMVSSTNEKQEEEQEERSNEQAKSYFVYDKFQQNNGRIIFPLSSMNFKKDHHCRFLLQFDEDESKSIEECHVVLDDVEWYSLQREKIEGTKRVYFRGVTNFSKGSHLIESVDIWVKFKGENNLQCMVSYDLEEEQKSKNAVCDQKDELMNEIFYSGRINNDDKQTKNSSLFHPKKIEFHEPPFWKNYKKKQSSSSAEPLLEIGLPRSNDKIFRYEKTLNHFLIKCPFADRIAISGKPLEHSKDSDGIEYGFSYSDFDELTKIKKGFVFEGNCTFNESVGLIDIWCIPRKNFFNDHNDDGDDSDDEEEEEEDVWECVASIHLHPFDEKIEKKELGFDEKKSKTIKKYATPKKLENVVFLKNKEKLDLSDIEATLEEGEKIEIETISEKFVIDEIKPQKKKTDIASLLLDHHDAERSIRDSLQEGLDDGEGGDIHSLLLSNDEKKRSIEIPICDDDTVYTEHFVKKQCKMITPFRKGDIEVDIEQDTEFCIKIRGSCDGVYCIIDEDAWTASIQEFDDGINHSNIIKLYEEDPEERPGVFREKFKVTQDMETIDIWGRFGNEFFCLVQYWLKGTGLMGGIGINAEEGRKNNNKDDDEQSESESEDEDEGEDDEDEDEDDGERKVKKIKEKKRKQPETIMDEEKEEKEKEKESIFNENVKLLKESAPFRLNFIKPNFRSQMFRKGENSFKIKTSWTTEIAAVIDEKKWLFMERNEKSDIFSLAFEVDENALKLEIWCKNESTFVKCLEQSFA